MHDPLQVCEAISDIDSGPSSVFTADYFSRPGFPHKVLFNISALFWFDGIPDDFLAQVCIRGHERGHHGIMSQVWCAFVLICTPALPRSVIDRFHQASSLPAR